jgi:hypothetical protein
MPPFDTFYGSAVFETHHPDPVDLASGIVV